MNFNELSGIKQWGVVIGGGILVTVALYFTVFKSQSDKNLTAQHAVDAKVKENNDLESYRPKLKQIDQQLAELKQQLEIERRIVPDDKQVDAFITTMDGEAQKAGVEVRRYFAKPTASKEYYTELPFDMEVDGPYYSMLNFFDRVGKLERIINVSSLVVTTTKNPSGAKVKHSYTYAPNESVIAAFTATTFFSHDLEPAAAPTTAGAPVKR